MGPDARPGSVPRCTFDERPDATCPSGINQKDLAAYLGTTAETVSRRLGTTMHDHHLIRLGPGRDINILDTDDLRNFRAGPLSSPSNKGRPADPGC